jgi:hypothetical protein
MSIIKLTATISLALAVITMVTSNQISLYASPTTEDDGWTEDEVDNDEDVEDMYDGSPWEFEDGNDEEESTDKLTNNGDDDDDGDDDDNDNDDDGPNPYCDTDKGKAASVCHDRLDYDQDTGLYPCNDGTNKVDWRDCKDATEKNGKNDGDSTKSIQTTMTTSISVEEASCRLVGSTDGIQQKFDSIKFQSCGLYLNGQKAYSDGFISGCAQVGNTQVICQALVESSISNTITQPIETETAIEPTQAIQPTAVS